ncbi:MAG: PHP domain-containing protein [Clostridia bacterium]|nr:PHP domain-containing protein [Clostridia bacterium]
MLQDLHSHTYYSFCGKDTPEAIVEAAIAGGLDTFGITDHNYGIGHACHGLFCAVANMGIANYERTLRRYFDHINLIKDKYADKIRVLRGIELCTLKNEQHPNFTLPEGADISFYDYCLIENLDSPVSVTGGDLFTYAKRCGTPVVGIAHTDLFGYIARLGVDPLDYFKRMADENIFWEMNVTYDSSHNYHQHQYFLDFFENEEQQDIVRRSGVRISVGFDGHRVEDYLPERVKGYCKRLTELGIKMPFEE